jgi:hypothetical protein
MMARARKKAAPRAAAAEPAKPAIEPAPMLTSVPPPTERAVVPPCPSPIELTLEFGMYGANSKPQKGALWRATFYDRQQGSFYAGSDDDPFVAVAWALYEREERISKHGAPTMARDSTLTPAQALERLMARP